MVTEDIMDQLRLGNEAAFEAIFRAYYPQVFATAYRLVGTAQEAEDVTQEAFLRLYLRPLPAGRQHNVLGWLLRVASNLAYNALRSRRRRQARESRMQERAPAPDDSPGVAESTEVAAAVRDILAHMPERQVQLLLLRQAGLSYAEIATALSIAEGSVGTLLARAERSFKEKHAGSHNH